VTLCCWGSVSGNVNREYSCITARRETCLQTVRNVETCPKKQSHVPHPLQDEKLLHGNILSGVMVSISAREGRGQDRATLFYELEQKSGHVMAIWMGQIVRSGWKENLFSLCLLALILIGSTTCHTTGYLYLLSSRKDDNKMLLPFGSSCHWSGITYWSADSVSVQTITYRTQNSIFRKMCIERVFFLTTVIHTP
jgi:hypothetical protein